MRGNAKAMKAKRQGDERKMKRNGKKCERNKRIRNKMKGNATKRKENKTTNNNQSAISEQDSKNLRDIKNTLTVMLSRNQEFEVTGSPLFNEEKLRVLINEENQKILEALAQKLLSEKPQVAEEVEQPVQPIETEDITRLKSEKETYRKEVLSLKIILKRREKEILAQQASIVALQKLLHSKGTPTKKAQYNFDEQWEDGNQ